MEKLDETHKGRERVWMWYFEIEKSLSRSQSKRHIPRIIPFRNKPSTKRQLLHLDTPRVRGRERDEGQKRRVRGGGRETEMPSINPGHN